MILNILYDFRILLILMLGYMEFMFDDNIINDKLFDCNSLNDK